MISKLAHLWVAFGLVFAFQNCSQTSSLQSIIPSLKLNGNGGPYEGKPDGTYYRFLPRFSCDGKLTSKEVTIIRDDKVFVYENRFNECAITPTEVPPSAIDLSPFQSDFIGINSKLFKRYALPPGGIPDNLAEALCRDDFANPSLEIITHFNHQTSEALVRIYQLDTQDKTLEPVVDQSIARIFSSSEVTYANSELQFKIHLDQLKDGKRFAGELFKLNGQLSQQTLTCISGGGLDTSRWPLQTLSETATADFNISVNGLAYFTALSTTGRLHFYERTDDQTEDLTTTLFSITDTTAQFSVAGPSIGFILNNRPDTASYYSPFLFSPSGRKIIPLGNEVQLRLQSYLTPQQHLLYLRTNFSSTSVTDLDLATGKSSTIFDSSGVATDFLPFPGINQLIVIQPKPYNYELTKIDLSSFKKSTGKIPIADGCGLMPVQMIPNDSSLLFHQVCADSHKWMILSLLDPLLMPHEVALNKDLVWSSKDMDVLVFSDSRTPPTFTAYFTREQTSSPLQFDPFLGTPPLKSNSSSLQSEDKIYSISSAKLHYSKGYLYGLSGTPDSPTLTQQDVASGRTIQLCADSLGKPVFLGALPSEELFLFTFDAISSIYHTYRMDTTTSQCRHLNSFPGKPDSLIKVVPVQDGFSIILNSGYDDLVFVPRDGKAAFRMNPDRTVLKSLTKIQVSPDKKFLYLLGHGELGPDHLFRFSLGQ